MMTETRTPAEAGGAYAAWLRQESESSGGRELAGRVSYSFYRGAWRRG